MCGCVVVMQLPVFRRPHVWSFAPNCVTKSPENIFIVLLCDCLSFRCVFVMHNSTDITEYSQHDCFENLWGVLSTTGRLSIDQGLKHFLRLILLWRHRTITLHCIRGSHIELCPASSGYINYYLKKKSLKDKTPLIKSSSRVPEKRKGLNKLIFLLEGPPIRPRVPAET